MLAEKRDDGRNAFDRVARARFLEQLRGVQNDVPSKDHLESAEQSAKASLVDSWGLPTDQLLKTKGLLRLEGVDGHPVCDQRVEFGFQILSGHVVCLTARR